MDFAIEPSEKFAMVVVSNLYPTKDLDKPLQLDDHTWFLPKIPVGLAENWKQWLGTIICERIEQANFVLIVKRHSDKPDIVDGINKALYQHVINIFYCLIFQGIPGSIDHIYILSGANVNKNLEIREYGVGDVIYDIDRSRHSIITRSKLNNLVNMTTRYESIYHNKEAFRRLGLGFHSLVRAVREKIYDFRVHDYVRAIEAVVKPKWPIRKSFVHRCQTLTKACQETQQILTEIYLLRSSNEHLNKWLEPLEGRYDNPYSTALERLWQAENLMLSTYTKLLLDSNLLSIFETDESIDVFWGKKDDERRAIWGEPLDIRRFKWVDKGYGVMELGEEAQK